MTFEFSYKVWVPNLHQDVTMFIEVDADSYEEAEYFVNKRSKKFPNRSSEPVLEIEDES